MRLSATCPKITARICGTTKNQKHGIPSTRDAMAKPLVPRSAYEGVAGDTGGVTPAGGPGLPGGGGAGGAVTASA